VMRQKLISAFVSLTILAAPSVGAAQWPAVVSSSPAQAPSPNPLFPERLGIPWFGVPQLPHPQPSGMQNGSLSPSDHRDKSRAVPLASFVKSDIALRNCVRW